MMAAERLAEGRPMIDVRCRNCGRLLLRIDAERARIEVVCPDNRCKRYQQHRIAEVSKGA